MAKLTRSEILRAFRPSPRTASALIVAMALGALATSRRAADGADAGLATPGPDEYAVYLSAEHDPQVPWGGYHVTVTGYSKNQPQDAKSLLAESWRKHFPGTKHRLSQLIGDHGWELKKFKGDKENEKTWRAFFSCDPLDKLADDLQAKGFQRVASTKKSSPFWHVSLETTHYGDAQERMKKLAHRTWHLWLVHGKTWERID